MVRRFLKKKKKEEEYFRENSPEYVSTESMDRWSFYHVMLPTPESSCSISWVLVSSSCWGCHSLPSAISQAWSGDLSLLGLVLIEIDFVSFRKEAAVIDSNVAQLPVNPLLRSNGVGPPISLGLAPNNAQVVNLNLWRKPGQNNAQMRAGTGYSFCAIYDYCTV